MIEDIGELEEIFSGDFLFSDDEDEELPVEQDEFYNPTRSDNETGEFLPNMIEIEEKVCIEKLLWICVKWKINTKVVDAETITTTITPPVTLGLYRALRIGMCL